MKKIAILLVFVFTATVSFSQKRKVHRAERMTLEQRTTLTVKKMTLALDLNKVQAKKIKALYTKMGEEKMAKRKMMKKERMEKREKLMKVKKDSKDKADFKRKVRKEFKEEELKKMRRVASSFEVQNRALDHMIRMQTEMKKILTEEQFKEYKKMKKRMKKVKRMKHVKRSR